MKWVYAALAALVIAFILVSAYPSLQKMSYEVQFENSIEEPHFKRVLSELLGPPFIERNKVQTLLNGDEIFPSMLQAIDDAKSTITFESYIYWSGEIGRKFADALSKKAKQGVHVHLLLDWLGSEKLDEQEIQKMKDAGVEVERYHKPHSLNFFRINSRTHRKILVVDGKVGFTGGVGIADEWTGNGEVPDKWRDTHYKIEGPVVAQLQAAFLDNWMKLRPQIHSTPEYFPKLDEVPKGGYSAQMFKSSSREGTSSVHVMYLLALAAAKKSILLESSYFVPDEVTIQEIIKARKRGVEVKVIVPGDLNDSAIVQHASKDVWGTMLEAGVQIFEYQKAMFHCKVLIVDDFFVSVGSTNFDERSFSLNDEANLNVLSREFAGEQTGIFARDLKLSNEVGLDEWKRRPIQEKMIEKVIGILHSQF
jgi:cardiolipin synthase